MNKTKPIAMGILLVLFAMWMQIIPSKTMQDSIANLDNFIYDLELTANIHINKHPENNVAIVAIDDLTTKKFGQWPWPRNKLATLIKDINNSGATVIALDITFTEPQANVVKTIINQLKSNRKTPPSTIQDLQQIIPDFDYDSTLAKAIAESEVIVGNVFITEPYVVNSLPQPIKTLPPTIAANSTFIQFPGYSGNVPILQQAAKNSGFLNAFPDDDGIIRHQPLVLLYNNTLYPSLALSAVRDFLLSNADVQIEKIGNLYTPVSVSLDQQIIPTGSLGGILIPFIGPPSTIPTYSAMDVLQHKIPSTALMNKIVFVGITAFGFGEQKATAISNSFPGVEVHATIASGILNKYLFYKPDWGQGFNFMSILILGGLCAALFPFLNVRRLIVLGIGLPVGIFYANLLFFHKTGIVLSITILTLLIIILAVVNLAYGYLVESRHRKHLNDIFGQYVSPQYINNLLKRKDSTTMSSETREMSVLFSDIRNFTTISESLNAKEVQTMLNKYFTPVTEVIFKNRGTIDKYVGDMVMAFWGAPLNDEKHAEDAIETAIGIVKLAKELQPLFIKEGLPVINVGVGVNSGPMSVGDMGSIYRRAYTVLGDSVNLASRLESLTRIYNVDIIVGENTQQSANNFVFRHLDCVFVKGKTKPVNIYEPVCKVSELTPSISEELELHKQALQYYLNKEWLKAECAFKELIKKYPDRAVYTFYPNKIESILKAS